MTPFSTELKRLMAERGISGRALARAVYCDPALISRYRSGAQNPTAQYAEAIDAHLDAGGQLAALRPPDRPRRAATAELPADDEIAALDLARRALASDVDNGTCQRIEAIVDDLATAYPRTAPAVLLARVRRHLAYASRLLDGRATLAQRRSLLVSTGWLSLLAATSLIDLHQAPAATAYLRTADQIAAEAGHPEIAAWVLETRAWMAITLGDYRQTAALARAAQDAAPKTGSAYIQATAQEGRALARLGDAAGTRAALGRVERIASPLAVPDQPEHHYRYDPQKAEAYTVTTLSWIADPAAEQAARDVLARLERPSAAPRPRRAAAARLDLGLALAGQGRHDEAAGAALEAVTSGYLVPSHLWRAEEIAAAIAGRDVPEAAELSEALRAVGGGQPPALR